MAADEMIDWLLAHGGAVVLRVGLSPVNTFESADEILARMHARIPAEAEVMRQISPEQADKMMAHYYRVRERHGDAAKDDRWP